MKTHNTLILTLVLILAYLVIRVEEDLKKEDIEKDAIFQKEDVECKRFYYYIIIWQVDIMI